MDLLGQGDIIYSMTFCAHLPPRLCIDTHTCPVLTFLRNLNFSYLTLVLLVIFLLAQVPVPRHSVGVVIGRSGEMIKKIQNDAGVRIQFKQGQKTKSLPCHDLSSYSMLKNQAY